MNGLVKPLRKKSDRKIDKTVKIKVKLPHVNKKPLARKRIFVQTPYSHSTLEINKIHAAKPLAFSLHFLFRRDQNHYYNLTKIMKMCEHILNKRQWQILWIAKKRQRPNTIQILWIVKNQEQRNIAPLSSQLRIYNQKGTSLPRGLKIYLFIRVGQTL